MKISEINNVVGLRDRLSKLNEQIEKADWHPRFTPETRDTFPSTYLDTALKVARNHLVRALKAERNDVLQALGRYGIIVEESN